MPEIGGVTRRSLTEIRKILRLTFRISLPVLGMTFPAAIYIWGLSESLEMVGLFFASAAGLSFYLIGDQLRDEPRTATNVDFDGISGYQRRLVIFLNVLYLNVVTSFGALIGVVLGSQVLALAGFASFFYPAADHWLGRKRWWLSPGVLVAGFPVFLFYVVGIARSQVARRLAIDGWLRDRGRNFVEYLDLEAFNLDLLEVGKGRKRLSR